MPMFAYKAYDKQGHVIESELEASDVVAVRTELQKQNLIVASIKKKSDAQAIHLPWKSDKVNLSDLEFLTSELAILLNSGVKIDKGLQIVAKGKAGTPTGKVVSEIVKNLKSGVPVSEAFKTKDNVFDDLYINLIEIGERSGRLAEVFDGLANDLKFKKALKAKVTQALTYPAIILFVCVACILFVFNYIVPQMGSIFAEGDDLPIYTAVLLGASEWMINYQLYLFVAIITAIGVVVKQRKTRAMKAFWSKHALSLPVVSDLVEQVERIRFNSAISLMLHAGVKVDVAVNSATKNVGNGLIRKSIEIANEKIKKGGGVSESLAMTPIFPAFYISLLEVGEQSGELATVFSEIAIRSKTDFEQWTDRVTNILEPLLILVMGGIVGSVVITMLLSVVSVNDISL